MSAIFDGKWLCASVIDSVLAELAVLPPGVQLMASESPYWIVEKLKANRTVESSDVVYLQPDTDTIVFSFNLCDHWCVAKATCDDKGQRALTMYNPASKYNEEAMETWLPSMLDCIIDFNSTPRSKNSCWPSSSTTILAKVDQCECLRQSDDYNCGIYTIFNALA